MWSKFPRWWSGAMSLATFAFTVWCITEEDWLGAVIMFVCFVLNVRALQSMPSGGELPPPSEDVTSTQETFLARGFEPVETPTDDGQWSDADWWQKHLRNCPVCRERD